MHSPELDHLDPTQKNQEQDLLLAISTLDPQSPDFLPAVRDLLIQTERFDPTVLEELFETLERPDLLADAAVEKVLYSSLNDNRELAAALTPMILAARSIPEAMRKAS